MTERESYKDKAHMAQADRQRKQYSHNKADKSTHKMSDADRGGAVAGFNHPHYVGS